MKIGEVNPEHFENIFTITEKDVVITEKQIAHIKERHPQDYERYAGYIPQIIKEPDYIIEANKPNSSVLLKYISENGEYFQLVLRLKAKTDPKDYRNSVISFWKIAEEDR
ncbi:MAG: PBECR2 nuclease fold domain-containing protein [Oscillospiraceae bacterium]|nr:PBECR2 nuclease fold domain-containing protein [Oscillospiraceae bacterium]